MSDWRAIARAPTFALDRLRANLTLSARYESTKPGPSRNAPLRLTSLELIDRLTALMPPQVSAFIATSACSCEWPLTGSFYDDAEQPELAFSDHRV